MEKLIKYLGFMTKSEAIENGFDKHGSYFGIPILIKSDERDFTICEKHAIFVPFTLLFSALENIFFNQFKDEYCDDDYGFLFKVKGDIK